MKINYNLSAMTTNTQLLKNEKGQQAATERLASGLKINHAKDDPAGMAMSNKMKPSGSLGFRLIKYTFCSLYILLMISD